jgi:hypothetical protein
MPDAKFISELIIMLYTYIYMIVFCQSRRTRLNNFVDGTIKYRNAYGQLELDAFVILVMVTFNDTGCVGHGKNEMNPPKLVLICSVNNIFNFNRTLSMSQKIALFR